MRRKGIEFKRASHLTYRHFNAEIDAGQCKGYGADYFERDPHGSYVVIVPVSRCLDAEGDFSPDLRDQAECLPFDSWSRTNMVYGHGWRRQTRGARFWVRLSSLPAEEQDQWRESHAQHGNQIHWDDSEEQDGLVPKWFNVYWTSTTYWVENGQVYTATGRTYEDPKMGEGGG